MNSSRVRYIHWLEYIWLKSNNISQFQIDS